MSIYILVMLSLKKAPFYAIIKYGVDNMQQYNYPAYRQYVPQPVVTEDSIKRKVSKKLRKRCNAVGFYALTYIATMNVMAIGFIILFQRLNITPDESLTQLEDIFISVGASLIPGILFMAATGFKPRDAFGKTSVGLTTLIPLILMGMAVAMAANYASDLFETNLSIFGLHNYAGQTESSAISPLEIILNTISVAIVPAFAEEFAYRGLVMGSLKKYGRAFAVIASSILFSAMHGNTTQIVFTFPAALVFGFIDMVADSIVPSIILHLLNNFYAILFTIFYSNNNLNERTVSIIQISVVLLFCISGILSFIYLAKTKKEIFKLSNNEKPLEQGAELLTLKNKISVFLVNPGVMISLSSFLLLTILSLIPQ